jgi:hypothetical protein
MTPPGSVLAACNRDLAFSRLASVGCATGFLPVLLAERGLILVLERGEVGSGTAASTSVGTAATISRGCCFGDCFGEPLGESFDEDEAGLAASVSFTAGLDCRGLVIGKLAYSEDKKPVLLMSIVGDTILACDVVEVTASAVLEELPSSRAAGSETVLLQVAR